MKIERLFKLLERINEMTGNPIHISSECVGQYQLEICGDMARMFQIYDFEDSRVYLWYKFGDFQECFDKMAAFIHGLGAGIEIEQKKARLN